MGRLYYSRRAGNARNQLSLQTLLELFKDTFLEFEEDGYFQEHFGYTCVDAGEIPGKLGRNVGIRVSRVIRKPNVWPVVKFYNGYSEDDLFDIVEFLYDHISKPVDGWEHTYGDCGWHYTTFDATSGQSAFRQVINELLHDYGAGFELSEHGEIRTLPEHGLETLLEAGLPQYDPDNVEAIVAKAVEKFRRRKSSVEDRKDAVRDLAGVLEYLRPKAKEVLLKSDEADLFNIANNFGVRHHNESQKTDYDRAIWYSWMFYYYLATIHAVVHLIKKKND